MTIYLDGSVCTAADPVKVQIQRFPGTAAKIARACGTTEEAVRAWAVVPIEYVCAVEALLGIPREWIRPDFFIADKDRRDFVIRSLVYAMAMPGP